MLAAITAFAVMFGSITAAPTSLIEQPDRGARAEPRDLVIVIDQDGPDRATLDAKFRLDTGASGDLWIESWTGDGAAVESAFSVDGVRHIWLRQVQGEEPEVWFSPEIEADPELMPLYWSVIRELAIHESTAKNPACGALKWGLKALTWFAAAACCGSGNVVACVACKAGGDVAHDAISGIDCNKECKPDCPIP